MDYDSLADKLREEGINELYINEMTFGGNRSGEWYAVRGSEKFCFHITKRIFEDKPPLFSLVIEKEDDDD